MKGLDVLAKVSGIPENKVYGIYEAVRNNQEKLGSCKRMILVLIPCLTP